MPCRSYVDISSLRHLFEEHVAEHVISHVQWLQSQRQFTINSGKTPVMAYVMSKCLLSQSKYSGSVPPVMHMIYVMILRGTQKRQLGKWLDSRRWTAALVRAGLTTPEMTDYFLNVSCVSRTKHAHQVTASVL